MAPPDQGSSTDAPNHDDLESPTPLDTPIERETQPDGSEVAVNAPDAPDASDLESRTVPQLRELADQIGADVPTDAKRGDLLEALAPQQPDASIDTGRPDLAEIAEAEYARNNPPEIDPNYLKEGDA